jgi:hypothetical protein
MLGKTSRPNKAHILSQYIYFLPQLGLISTEPFLMDKRSCHNRPDNQQGQFSIRPRISAVKLLKSGNTKIVTDSSETQLS